jgi:hypothetical protein
VLLLLHQHLLLVLVVLLPVMHATTDHTTAARGRSCDVQRLCTTAVAGVRLRLRRTAAALLVVRASIAGWS